jgi:protein tyrosine phosphatase (PTP) superfamily phosphohydrolase (DUF442 family)
MRNPGAYDHMAATWSETVGQIARPGRQAGVFTWALCRNLLQGLATGLVLAAIVEVGRVTVGRNLHEVVPGQVYRSAQLSPASMAEVVRRYGIRSIVNLRGCSDPEPWYEDEVRATQNLDIAQEDVGFSAGRLPPACEVRRLIEALDNTEYPILLHCRQGKDRTGIAAVVVMLLQTDAPLSVARRQLGLRYGHLPLGRPGNLDRFFDLYEQWLVENHVPHSAGTFRQWVDKVYRPADCSCALEILELPAHIQRDRCGQVRVRARNTGMKAWHFLPGTNAGVHGCFMIWDADDQGVASERFGLYRAQVPPGGTIDLTFPIPPLRRPGKYRMMVDLRDEQQCWFYQVGSEPLEVELMVE